MKKAIALILGLALMLAALPPFAASVSAEDAKAAISIGAGNIEKGNKVYMGIRIEREKVEPVSWLVLGEANSTALKNGDESVDAKNARLLLTEKTQTYTSFNMRVVNNVYQGSDIQNWCARFMNDGDWNGERYQDRFSGLEKEAMLSTSKTDDAYDTMGSSYGASTLENETVFNLSAEEVLSDDYGYFDSNESRIAYEYNSDGTQGWWLRSPCSNNSIQAACVEQGGTVSPRDVQDDFWARPAFNINLNSVLFTSAAEGAKSSGAAGADAMTAVPETTTNEWKLTLLDSCREFSADFDTSAVSVQESGYADWTVNITYMDAQTGDNEYVSVILADEEGNALYYGNIAQGSASGTAAVNIPEGLPAGTYTLHVFSEQKNGDYLTDYASEFSDLDIEVKEESSVCMHNQSVSETVKKATLSSNGKIETVCDICGETVEETTIYSPKTFQLSASSYTYDGTAKKPKVTVKDSAGTTIASSNYTVSYADNVKAGVATAKVTFKGDYYSGSKKLTFKVCFKDVPVTHAYQKAVYWAAGKGVAAGYSGSKEGIFGVSDDITRGQVVMFLWRAAGKPAPKKTSQTFKDVPTNHNFYKAIQWAVEEGITGGYTGEKAGYFGPNDNCTRGQIVTFLWRYAGKPAPKKTTQTFKDVPTSHNFYKAIQWASENGVTAGFKDGTFGINKTCTRGQCVTFLYRLESL